MASFCLKLFIKWERNLSYPFLLDHIQDTCFPPGDVMGGGLESQEEGAFPQRAKRHWSLESMVGRKSAKTAPP